MPRHDGRGIVLVGFVAFGLFPYMDNLFWNWRLAAKIAGLTCLHVSMLGIITTSHLLQNSYIYMYMYNACVLCSLVVSVVLAVDCIIIRSLE